MEFSLDVLVQIFLSLENRNDMLNFLLVCKYFNRVTEKYSTWLKLYSRYYSEDIHFHPDFDTLVEIFKSGFHRIEMHRQQFYNVKELQKENPLYDEEILGIFNIFQRGLIAVHRGGSKAFTLRHQEKCARLYSHRSNYGINFETMSLGTKSDQGYFFSIEGEENVHELLLDFIGWLQQCFDFEQISFYFNYSVEVMLTKAKVKINAMFGDIPVSETWICDYNIRFDVGYKPVDSYTGEPLKSPQREVFIQIDSNPDNAIGPIMMDLKKYDPIFNANQNVFSYYI